MFGNTFLYTFSACVMVSRCWFASILRASLKFYLQEILLCKYEGEGRGTCIIKIAVKITFRIPNNACVNDESLENRE